MVPAVCETSQGTPARLAQAHRHHGQLRLHQRRQPLQRMPEHRGQLRCHHGMAGNALAMQRLRDEPAGVARVAAKRTEPGEQNHAFCGLWEGLGSWAMNWDCVVPV